MRRIQLTQAMKMDAPGAPYIVGDKDATLTLPDYAAHFAVNMGNAKYLDSEPKLPPPRAQQERQEQEIGTLRRMGEESSQPDSEPEEVKKPYGNAPKSAWVRYACSVDDKMTEERAETLTKADLMSRYGERL